MLGLRHYKGKAIDLWQGPSGMFFCPWVVELGKDLQLPESFNKPERHLALRVAPGPYEEELVKKIFTELKEKIPVFSCQRLTFVIEKEEDYEQFSQSLLALIPDEA